jgi:hypothetical protein
MLSIAPLMAAAGPTTQPTTRPDRFNGQNEVGRRGRMGGGQRMPQLDPGTAADWESIAPFMKVHSQNRLKFINGLSDGPMKFAMMNNMVRVSRNLERLDREDPELSHVVTKRVELEDQVFGLARDLRNADPVEADQIKQTLGQKVAELVDTNLDERQLRIDRLTKTLNVEQQNLARDKDQSDQLVADKLKRIIDEAQRPNGPLEMAHSEPVLASPETSTDVTPTQKQK